MVSVVWRVELQELQVSILSTGSGTLHTSCDWSM